MIILRDLKVRNKLLLLTLLVLGCVGGVIGANLYFLDHVKVGGDMYKQIAARKETIATAALLAADLGEIRGTLFEMVVTPSVSRRARLSDEIQTLSERVASRFDQLREQVSDEHTLAALEDAKRTWEAFSTTSSRDVPEALARRDQQAALELVQGMQKRRYERFSGQVESIIANARMRIKESEDTLAVAVSDSIQLSIAISIGGVALVVAIAFLITLSISRPLNVIMQLAQRVAAGDLREVKIDVQGRDEIGQLTSMFQLMVSNLRTLVLGIASTAVQLGSSSNQLSTTAHRQQQGATEQLAAIEETRSALESVAVSALEVSNRVREVRKHAEDNREHHRQVDENLALLVSHTQRIGEALDVIKDIANKTDLLALNAALEGTKAGEAGRGFSIVANQMQRLAVKVMATANDIRLLNHDIREASHVTVLTTERATGLSKQTTTSVQAIDVIAAQQQSGSRQVSEAMQDILAVAREFVGAGHEVLTSANDLTSLALHLNQLVDTFQVEDDEESAANVEVPKDPAPVHQRV